MFDKMDMHSEMKKNVERNKNERRVMTELLEALVNTDQSVDGKLHGTLLLNKVKIFDALNNLFERAVDNLTSDKKDINACKEVCEYFMLVLGGIEEFTKTVKLPPIEG